jgi:hypothetical protein
MPETQQLHRGDLVTIGGGVPASGVIEGVSNESVAVRQPSPLASDKVTLYQRTRLGRVHCPHAILALDSWVLNEPQWVMSRVEWEHMPFDAIREPGEQDWRVRIAEPKWSICKNGSDFALARVFPAFGGMEEVTDESGKIVAIITKIRTGMWHVSITGCDVAIVPSPRRAYQLIFGLSIRLLPNQPVDDRPLAELRGKQS